MFSDLMKFTAVNESLSKQSRNVLFQRKTHWFNKNVYDFAINIIKKNVTMMFCNKRQQLYLEIDILRVSLGAGIPQ